MFYVVLDLGCAECGESSNVLGVFTSEELARQATNEYKEKHRLDEDSDHEFFIYRINEVDKIHHNSYDHLLDS
ncbi:DUF7336 domain-containing protein [Metabacillus sp. HB246100]